MDNSWVGQGGPNSNHVDLILRTVSDNGGGIRSYVKVNLTAAGLSPISIQSTIIQLYQSGANNWNGNNVDVYEVNSTAANDIWNQNQVTWNNQPCGSTVATFNSSCNSTPSTFVTINGAEKYYNFTITDLSQRALSRGSNSFTLVFTNLTSEQASDQKEDFASSRNSSTYSPIVYITYTGGSSSPPIASTIIINSPTNTTYQLASCLNLSFDYLSYGNSTFSLLAQNDANILLNNAAYPNNTHIVNYTQGDINVTNNFTVQANNAGNITTSSIFFTCLLAQSAIVSDPISLFFGNSVVLSIIVILIFNMTWIGIVSIGRKGNKKVPVRLFLVSCFLWAALFVSASILDSSYIMIFVFVISALITYLYQKTYMSGVFSYQKAFISYFVFFAAVIFFEGLTVFSNPIIFGINPSSTLFTSGCGSKSIPIAPGLTTLLAQIGIPFNFTISGNPVVDTVNCANVYFNQFSVLWKLNSNIGIINDILIASFFLFLVLYAADWLRGRGS